MKMMNRSQILKAIKEGGDAKYLEFASPQLKNDKAFILELLRFNLNVMKYMSDELKLDYIFTNEIFSNAELMLKYIQKDGTLLALVDDHLADQKDIVLSAVSQNGLALEFASNRLKADPDVIRVAIQQNPKAADFELSSKTSIINRFKYDPYLLEDLGEDLRNDFDIMFEAVSQNIQMLKYASIHLQNNAQILAITKNPEIMFNQILRFGYELFSELDFDLLTNRDFILKILQKKGLGLFYVDDLFRDDLEIVLAAIQNEPSALIYASDRLQKDPRVLKVIDSL